MIANSIYVFIISVIGITVGIILKYFWPRIKNKTIKLPLIKSPPNGFQFSYFCIGIALALFEIAKFAVWGSTGRTDPAEYIPIYISSYFMYLFIANGFTRKGSFCNISISSATYINVIMLWIFLFVTTSTMHNGIAILLWHHDRLNFEIWHTIIYHTISLICGITFLIVNSCKINAWSDCLKGLIPLAILSTIAYFCSTFPPYETVDAFGNYNENVVTRGVYNGVGQIMSLYNLVVWIIQMVLFIACYYAYYIVSVLIPRLIKWLSRKNRKSNSPNK